MRVVGMFGKTPLHIQVDSGSTHNFLDLEYARSVECKLDQIHPLEVTVTDGNHIPYQYQCRNFQWQMHNHTFITNVMCIPIGSCDMVLGVEWLETLGDIQWNFKGMLMKFVLGNQEVRLKGVLPQRLQVVEGKVSLKLLFLYYLHLKLGFFFM